MLEKNHEVLGMGMKGCEGAQGFGETGINLIMLEIWHQDPFVDVVTRLGAFHHKQMHLLLAAQEIIIKRLVYLHYLVHIDS